MADDNTTSNLGSAVGSPDIDFGVNNQGAPAAPMASAQDMAPQPPAPPSDVQESPDQMRQGPQAPAPPAPVGSRLGTILGAIAGVVNPSSTRQAVGGVLTTIGNGIAGAANQKGRPSFAGGMVGGAQSELEYKFKTLEDAHRAAQLTMQDKELHLREQEAQDNHDAHVLGMVKANQDNGIEYDVIPNTATAVKQYMGSASAAGGIQVPAGALVTTGSIYIPKQGPNTNDAQFSQYKDLSGAYMMPQLGKFDSGMYQRLVYKQQGLKDNGTAFDAKELPQQIAIYQHQLDYQTANGGKTAVLNSLKDTIGNLQSQLKSADKHESDKVTSDTQARLAVENSPDNQQAKARQAGLNASQEQTQKLEGDRQWYQKQTQSDVTGWKPDANRSMSEVQFNNAQDKFATGPLAKAQDIDKSYEMFQKAYAETHDDKGNYRAAPSGAPGMVALSTHLATTFGNVKGSRITKDMIQEHLGARSVSDDALVAVQKLSSGDPISPKQWDAFKELITDSRKLTWDNTIKLGHTMGLPMTSDMLPQDLIKQNNQPNKPQGSSATPNVPGLVIH